MKVLVYKNKIVQSGTIVGVPKQPSDAINLFSAIDQFPDTLAGGAMRLLTSQPAASMQLSCFRNPARRNTSGQ